jgi:hypothetical protein
VRRRDDQHPGHEVFVLLVVRKVLERQRRDGLGRDGYCGNVTA